MYVRERLFNKLKEKIKAAEDLEESDVISLFHLDGASDDELLLPVDLDHPGLDGILEGCKDLTDIGVMVGKLGLNVFADAVIKAWEFSDASGKYAPISVREIHALKRFEDGDFEELNSQSSPPFSNTSILDDGAEEDAARCDEEVDKENESDEAVQQKLDDDGNNESFGEEAAAEDANAEESTGNDTHDEESGERESLAKHGDGVNEGSVTEDVALRREKVENNVHEGPPETEVEHHTTNPKSDPT